MTLTATKTTTTDMTLVPASFDQLYEHYYSFVVQLIKRRGIKEQNAEDVAQAILLKFWEKDVLSQFNPEMIVRSGRKTIFGSFLGAFILGYLPKHWERQNKLSRFEFDLIDESIDWETDQQGARSWLDQHGYSVEDDVSDFEEQEMATIIRARLMLAEPINGQDQCSFPKLFDAIRQRTLDGDKPTVVGLMEEFGVSKPTMRKWLTRLRAEVDRILEEN